MTSLLPAGASRLVSKASRCLRAEPVLPQYPSNSRCFVHLDARLLPHWHTLFDICPTLLKLDPPEGLNLFRSFMTWAYHHQPPLDWTYHLNVCRWLLGSTYRAQIDEEPIEAFMAAAAACWIHVDNSRARGIVLGWQGTTVFDWKGAPIKGAEHQALPALAGDFAWSPLNAQGEFSAWRPVP
ncbi:putative natural product biosynthesis protein [Pseudomonas sp. BCA14]|uniref:putative natural product biosynthesis protein n=1 Tax=unclassified Pseudomonas TaxID=196821 RepID=UPI00106F0420|nr:MULTISPECIES: putative natural product biosynthesis protein [unclassified Pseudomonas]TFF14035.1 putative natural product biosynthesis protein [Pseudomonas sp. JMN1]TFF15282.1 putative natural product biosynthesis protein [Pseudomonas sp. BCA17]TFF31689.1 putative natural product biosynthesis protein [Pseudomonas sp. BCA14]TFF32641.1 putative natural product biosynthesis protein [Pseudomonas sp. BCA13]